MGCRQYTPSSHATTLESKKSDLQHDPLLLVSGVATAQALWENSPRAVERRG
jgi:hypothetical protein